MRKRTALLWYFALAFAISWTGVILASTRPQPRVGLVLAMLAGPSLASLGLTALAEGTHGLRSLARRVVRVRIGARAYAALLLAPALLLVILGALSRVSPQYSPGNALVLGVSGGLVVGLFEELGWTGFATPRLLRGRTWLAAGLMLGLPWAVWHAAADWMQGARYGALWSVHMLEWIVALTAYRVFMTWMYARTESVFLAILLHASFTGSQLVLWPNAASVHAELLWYGLFACALWIVVGVVVARTGVMPSVAASADEKRRPLAGDAVVRDAFFSVTHAITIDSPPEHVWPWLAQLGATRAGWYSYDAIDNGGVPSADRIRDELQRVAPGDVLPALPGATDAFVVAAVEPPRDLVLTVPGIDGAVMSWEHFVEPVAPARSRLVVRARVAREWQRMAHDAGSAGARTAPIEYVYRLLARLPDAWMSAIGRAGHRFMEARHMRGIKRRAEALT